ncbi:hypothetical protein WDU94_012845 [Cyamophila willieti]
MKEAIEHMRKIMSILRGTLNEVKLEHEGAIADPEAYVGNPINCFKLTKRLSVDFASIYQNLKIAQTRIRLPSFKTDSLRDLMKVFNEISHRDRSANILKYGGVNEFHNSSGLQGDEIFLFYLLRRYYDMYYLQLSTPQELFDEGTLEKVQERSFALNKSNDILYDSSATFQFLVDYFFERDT